MTVRRGMTLLEVVFAVVLLALVASAVSSAISFVMGSEVRAQKRLGAYELANRLVLQYLDDKRELPLQSDVLDYDRFRYRYELETDQVRMRLPSLGTQRDVLPQANNRFEQVRVRVFAVDENLPLEPKAEELATLTRVIDPFTMRNPDAIERVDTDELIQRLQELIGSDLPINGAPPAPTASPGSGAGGGRNGGRGGR